MDILVTRLFVRTERFYLAGLGVWLTFKNVYPWF
jgi:hypothetical protein